MNREQFRRELEALINKHGMERGSNTPDFILADYLMDSLDAFNAACIHRSCWHDKARE